MRAFETAEVDFPVELFADANVTRPRADDPSLPVDRACELFFESETNTVRTLDRSQFIPSVFIEEVFEAGLEDELVGEFVFPASVARDRIEEVPEFHRMIPDVEASLQYRIYEDVPFGMSLYDDLVDLRAYDLETGAIELVADTDDPEAVAWAEEVYEHYRERARHPADVEEIPDWLPDPDLEF